MSNAYQNIDAGQWAALVRDAPQVRIYKEDRRSKVWQIDTPAGPAAVKRFEHSPLRQRLAMLVQLHPAQLEMRVNRRLAAAGVPVVPIVAAGGQAAGLGVKRWLVTRVTGQALQRTLRDGASHDQQRQLALQVGELAAALVAGGWYFRDLKTSNIIVIAGAGAQLIDVGSARKSRSRQKMLRMLAMLEHTAARDGVSAANRLRALNPIAKALGEPTKPLARDIAAVAARLGG